MRMIVNNAITVQEPTDSMRKWCANRLTTNNPDYIKKEALGKWTGNIPRTLQLYDVVGNELVLPFGCLRTLFRILQNKVEWVNEVHTAQYVPYASDIKPYPYQEEAITACLRARNGVLVMPCGSGKTQCGLEIIARLGGRALWLTHTQDLLNQSKKRAESLLRCGRFGTITAGKVDIGETITFATVQTMCKLDLAKYRDAFDVIICDECQHAAGSPTRVTQFYKVMSNLSARYKFGLTATPKRADGLEVAMFALLGGIIHEVSREAVAANTCEVRINTFDTGWEPEYDCVLNGDGTIDYNRVVEAMTHDQERFDFVLNEIKSLPVGAPILVLANRVDYLKRMSEAYDGVSLCISGSGNNKKAKEDRKKALQQLNDGNIDCLFASYKLSAEGLDVPNLRYIVFATPEKDETTVIQSVGRVGRAAHGKEYGTVIDFVDDFGMYRSWAKKRAGFYKKIGAKKY